MHSIIYKKFSLLVHKIAIEKSSTNENRIIHRFMQINISLNGLNYSLVMLAKPFLLFFLLGLRIPLLFIFIGILPLFPQKCFQVELQ